MSDAYDDADLVAEAPDPLFRPVWEDTRDQAELRPGLADGLARDRTRPASRHQPDPWLQSDGLPALLCLLCDAQNALARLDAVATTAPPAVREGLCARMAFAEAAGWLAHAHAPLHPLDLALADLGLTGAYAIATCLGRPLRDMPNTYVRRASGAWEERDTAELLAGEAAAATALMLARQLTRLARTREDPLTTLAGASAVLNQFGPAGLDGTRFVQWRAGIAFGVGSPPNEAGGAGEGARVRQLPPLLAAARAAERWISGGIVELPNALQAYLAAAGTLVGRGVLRAVIPPLWTAYPALGQPAAAEVAALPLLRSDVAARLRSPMEGGSPSDWLLALLHLLAEGARATMRELDRLLGLAERGRGLIAGCDRRSRLPAALDLVLRRPVLTPKAVAAKLAIAPQTATALLRELRAAQVVAEITGRRSFRAFALVSS